MFVLQAVLKKALNDADEICYDLKGIAELLDW